MKDELLKIILPIIEKTKEGILRGIEVVQEQVPDLIHQLLAWKFAFHMTWVLLSLIMMVIFILITIWTCKSRPEHTDNWTIWDTKLVISIFTGILATIALCSLPHNIFNMIQIKVAPKIYLLEYISRMTQN